MRELRTRTRAALILSLATGALCALIWRAGSAQQPPASQVPLQKSPVKVPENAVLPQTIPCAFWGGLPVIMASVNGSPGTEKFIVATGLNACTVTNDAYARLKLQALTTQIRLNVFDSKTQAVGTEVQMQMLQIGSLHLEKVNAALIDIVSLLSPRPRPDVPTGWIGSPFLSAFQITLDFQSRYIALSDARGALPNDKDMVVVPITIKEGRCYTKVSIPGAKPFLALIDSGTVGNLIPTDVAAKLKLPPKQVFPLSQRGKEGRAVQTIVPRLAIGKAEVQNLNAVFIAADGAPEFDRSLGVLGVDFLRHYKVTLNYVKQKMALAPHPAPENTATDSPAVP